MLGAKHEGRDDQSNLRTSEAWVKSDAAPDKTAEVVQRLKDDIARIATGEDQDVSLWLATLHKRLLRCAIGMPDSKLEVKFTQ